MAISLSGCAGFPKLKPHILSVKNQQAAEYEVSSQSNACDIDYKFKQWRPISEVDGYVCLSPEDVASIKEYQAQQCARPQAVKQNGN